MTDAERAGLYVQIWSRVVEVQQHFNDIEWRIRALALSVATFAIGAAGLAANGGREAAALLILGVGLILWAAFYFVEAYWYHPLLKAAVDKGAAVEAKLREMGVDGLGLTEQISAGSGVAASRKLWPLRTRENRKGNMRSSEKLEIFYRIGACAFLMAMLGIVVFVLLDRLDISL